MGRGCRRRRSQGRGPECSTEDGSEYSTDSSSTIAASPGLSDEVMALVQAAMQAKPSGSPM
jgi:hypothetical protein